MDTRTEELIAALESIGQDWRDYSGRNMFGDSCVGVTLDGDGELWTLAQELALEGIEVDAPKTDSMGLGIIAYWPKYKLTKEDLKKLQNNE